jgi:hypothetical protein
MSYISHLAGDVHVLWFNTLKIVYIKEAERKIVNPSVSSLG